VTKQTAEAGLQFWRESMVRLGFEPALVDALLADVSLRSFRRHDVVLTHDDRGSAAMVLDGYLAIRIADLDGHEFIVAVVRRGQALLVSPITVTGVARAHAVGLSSGTVGIVARDTLLELAERYPILARRLIELSGEQTGRVLSRLQEVTFHSSRERLAIVLLAYGPLLGPGVHLLTRPDLAGLIGASREMLGLLLRDFEQDGIVTRDGRSIAIHDPGALREIGRWGEDGEQLYRDLRGPMGEDALLDA
jgi:CRP/FNR family transcriptional regulator, cyclic AMP receptor protein